MSSDYVDLSPFQRLALAWNEINNARQDIPAPLYVRCIEILNSLDTVLRELPDGDSASPIPLAPSPCAKCGGKHV